MLKLNVLDYFDRLDKTKYVTQDVLNTLRTVNQNMKIINDIPIPLADVTNSINKFEELRTNGRVMYLDLLDNLDLENINEEVAYALLETMCRRGDTLSKKDADKIVKRINL